MDYSSVKYNKAFANWLYSSNLSLTERSKKLKEIVRRHTEKDNIYKLLDPLSALTITNRSKALSDKNRQLVAEDIVDSLNLDCKKPSDDFASIPRSTFSVPFYFTYSTKMTEDDLKIRIELSERYYPVLVEYARGKTDKAIFIKAFDELANVKGCSARLLSILLYWIDYDFYIPLDNNTTNLLKKKGYTIPSMDKVDGSKYIEIIETLKNDIIGKGKEFKDIAQLSLAAIDASGPESPGEDEGPSQIEAKIWKVSHGVGSFSPEEIDRYLGENQITVHADNTRMAFVNKMSVGDYFYLCNGNKKVLLVGKVTSDSFDNSMKDGWKSRQYEVICQAINDSSYSGPKHKWTPSGFSTISEVKPELYDSFQELILKPFFGITLEQMLESRPEDACGSYSKDMFLKDAIAMDENSYDEAKRLLRLKHNIIFQGPPGVGKTYLAKRFIKALLNGNDKNRVNIVQFHQGYSYEEFIIGLKPTDNGSFEPEPGFFKKLCDEISNKDGDYFLIIDEINRGNISAIFGEAMMLIEHGHRGESVKIGFGESLTVPNNLYIIGTMNTADRSIAIMDYALRRRFAFIDLKPNLEKVRDMSDLGEGVANLIDKVIELNKNKIEPTFGPGFCIGHSYFMGATGDTEKLSAKEIVDYELDPLIHEYWFDDRKKADELIRSLR